MLAVITPEFTRRHTPSPYSMRMPSQASPYPLNNE